jgi:hypothetical protein
MLVLLPEPEVPPEEVPPALEPLVIPSSFRHFSRSAPIMPRHLLLVLPEAPLEPDVPALPLLGELGDALGELGDALLGELGDAP